MPLYTQLPDEIQKVDVVVAGGKLPKLSSVYNLLRISTDFFQPTRRNGRLHRRRPAERG